MFAYGTVVHGLEKQERVYCDHDNKCKCLCEQGTVDYTCKTKTHRGYNLYAFKKQGRVLSKTYRNLTMIYNYEIINPLLVIHFEEFHPCDSFIENS